MYNNSNFYGSVQGVGRAEVDGISSQLDEITKNQDEKINEFAQKNGLVSLTKPRSYQSAEELISMINVGWNLGNTLENTSVTPYNEDILKKMSYKVGTYVLDALGAQNLLNSFASQTLSSSGTQTVNAIISITSTNLTKIPTRGKMVVANYAIGDCGSDTMTVNVTNFQITLSGGAIINISEMLGERSFVRGTNGEGGFTIPINWASYGIATMADLNGATMTYTVNVIDWWIPANPPTEGQWTEKLLNNPITTKDILKGVKDKGFNAIRIPTTWFRHVDESDNITTSWLNHVKQIIDWCLELDLYVVLNMHHDGHHSGGWMKAYVAEPEITNMVTRFNKYWTQIANHFKTYDERLIFEGFNEVLDINSSWASPSEAEQTTLNLLAQNFVNTVRATESINATRVLSINTYGATSNYSLMQMPTDTATNKLIAQVHYYNPQPFCFRTGDGTGSNSVVSYDKDGADGLELTTMFTNLKTKFVDNGYPVIIGEFASYNKSGNTAERTEHAIDYVEKALSNGIKVFWWDAGGDSERAESVITTGALYKRTYKTWWFESIANGLVEVAESTLSPDNVNIIESLNSIKKPVSTLEGKVWTANSDGTAEFKEIDTPTIGNTWLDWTPTINWAGNAPLEITIVARYVVVGKTVNFGIYLESTDGNGASGRSSITLPIAPKNTFLLNPLVCFNTVGSTDTVRAAYVRANGTNNDISFLPSPFTAGQIAKLYISGAYEIA